MPVSKIDIDRIDSNISLDLLDLLNVSLLPNIERTEVVIADNDGTLTNEDIGISSINGEKINDFYAQTITYLTTANSFLLPRSETTDISIVSTESSTYFIGQPLEKITTILSTSSPERDISLEVFENPYTGGPGDDNFTGPYDPENPNSGGDDFDNVMIGGAGTDRLQGGGGDDTIIAGEGDDLILVGNGVDVIFTGDGADLIRVSKGVESVVLEDFDIDRDYIDLRQIGTDFTLTDTAQGVTVEFDDGSIIEFSTDAKLSKSHFVGQIGEINATIDAARIQNSDGSLQPIEDTKFIFTLDSDALDQNEEVNSSKILITKTNGSRFAELVSLKSGGSQSQRFLDVDPTLEIQLDPTKTSADVEFLITSTDAGDYEYDIEFIASGQEVVRAGGEIIKTNFEVLVSTEHSISQRINDLSVNETFAYDFVNASDRIDGTYVPVGDFNADLTGETNILGFKVPGFNISEEESAGFNVDVGAGRAGATLSAEATLGLRAGLGGTFAVEEDRLSKGELSIANKSTVLISENITLGESSAAVLSGVGNYSELSPNWESSFSHRQVDLDTKIALTFFLNAIAEIKLRGNPPIGDNFDIFKFGFNEKFSEGYTVSDFGDDGDRGDIEQLNNFLTNFGQFIEDISLSDPIIVAQSGISLESSAEDKIVKNAFPFQVLDPGSSVIESNEVGKTNPNVSESISEFFSFKINLHDLIGVLGPKGKALAAINSQGISGSKSGFGFQGEYDLFSLTIEPTLYLKQVTTVDNSNVRAAVTLEDGSNTIVVDTINESFDITDSALEANASLTGSANVKSEYFIGFDADLVLGLLIASVSLDTPFKDFGLGFEVLRDELTSLTNGIEYVKINEVNSIVQLDPNAPSAVADLGPILDADRVAREESEFISLRDSMSTFDASGGTDTILVGFSTQSATLDISGPEAVGLTDRSAVDGEVVIKNAEFLLFDDQLIDLQEIDRAYEVSDGQLREIVELYTVFDRAPDALGLAFWADKLAEGMEIEDISGAFFTALQEETGIETNDSPALVEAVYQALLGRSSDTDGKMFWIDELASGRTTAAEFINSFIDGINQDTTVNADFAYFKQKVDIGYEFAVLKGGNNVALASSVMDALGDQADAEPSKATMIIDEFFAAVENNIQGDLIVNIIGGTEPNTVELFEVA